MLQPNALSTLTSVFTEPHERARAIGIWASVFGASAAAGPVIGGLLVGSLGWRWLFWANLPIVTAAYLASIRAMPETRTPDPRRLDATGQVLAITTLAPLTYAIIEGPSTGWRSPLALGAGALAAASLTAFVTVERRQPLPLLDVRLFAVPRFAGAVAIAVLAFVILSGFLFLNTLYLQDTRGDAPITAGLLTLPATAIVVIVSPLTGRLMARRGVRTPTGRRRDHTHRWPADPRPHRRGDPLPAPCHRLPADRHRPRAGQPTDHQHRRRCHAERPRRRRIRHRHQLPPTRQRPRRRRHRLTHRHRRRHHRLVPARRKRPRHHLPGHPHHPPSTPITPTRRTRSLRERCDGRDRPAARPPTRPGRSATRGLLQDRLDPGSVIDAGRPRVWLRRVGVRRGGLGQGSRSGWAR